MSHALFVSPQYLKNKDICILMCLSAEGCSDSNCSRDFGDIFNPSNIKKPKRVAKRCDVEECEKQAQQGGKCIQHGAKTKRCDVEGCDKMQFKVVSVYNTVQKPRGAM